MFTIYNATFVTMDDSQPHIVDGAMVVDQGTIIEIGRSDEIQKQGELIDMQGKLVMPGLINTHTHTHSSIFRNLGDDRKLMDWLENAMWPMEKVLTEEIAYDATSLSCLEFIRGGITTYADQFYFANEIAYAAQDSGLRCFLAATVFENGCAETSNTLERAVNFIEKWSGREKDTLVYPCIGPHAPYSVSEEQFHDIVEIAKEYKLLIHIHISETADENRSIQEKYQVNPTQWLDSLGVLEQRVLAAHSIHLSEQDLEIYQRNQVAVSYNPVSNLKLVSGDMPIEKMLERDILVSIGTDGAQSNNSMDLLQDIKIGTLIQKQKMNSATFLKAKECVKMMTINGAKALGMENEIGSLEVGKKADFIAFDIKSVRMVPLHRDNLENLYATIVYSATGADVADTVVNGRWLMKNKEVLSMNEVDILARGQKASEYLVQESKKYL